MRHLLTTLLMLLVLIACGEGQGDRARISGTIKGLGTDTIYIYGSDQMFDRVDTLFVSRDKFKRDVVVDTLAQAWMLFRNGQHVPLFLNKRSVIHIKGDTTNLLNLQIEDKAENTLLGQFRAMADSEPTLAQVDSFVLNNPSSTVSLYLLKCKLLQSTNRQERLQLRPLLDSISEDLKHEPAYINLFERISQVVQSDTGRTVRYFRVRGTDNHWVSRTDFSNKWLLIHFWASWHDASRQQLRTLYKPFYKEIEKEKLSDDFFLWGISLDVDRRQWVQAVNRDTIAWKQSCELKGWNTEPVDLFNIQTLPTNVLISPDGKIKAYNLTLKQLEAKLKEVKEEKENKEKEEKEKKKKKK